MAESAAQVYPVVKVPTPKPRPQRLPWLASGVRCYRQPVDGRYSLAIWGGTGFPLIRTRLRSYGLEALASSGDLNDFDQVCTPDVAREWRQNLEEFAFSDRDFTVGASPVLTLPGPQAR